ncbi:ribonuclease D [Thiolinea disciformis]|uniref:ribonuclease D n=1 Tax=Thiolinea disciformis TaxID=125614 RepID=UPI00037B2E17|nr:ribonuclease D [Thiolinea disciformis]
MFEYIDTNIKLENFLQTIQTAKWVILDTEFIREKTYYPRLCLIQLATDQQLACIDPLTITNLEPFFQFLRQTDRVKVLHAAWQDLEIFYYLSGGQTLSPIFDSQIAAAVLGLGDQLGYARLVEDLLGVQLDKSQSRTDWARRPLNKAQLAYAIDDVRYLRDLYPILQEKLASTGRATWVSKPFKQLSEADQYQPAPRSSWERVKMVQLLKPRQLSILRELAAWRESLAIEKDLPRRWLVSDEILIDMARMKPNNLSEFKTIRGLSDEQIARYGAQWLELIALGYNLPTDSWPQLPRRRKLDNQLSLVADLLMVIVNQQALQHNISPQMLATRQQVEKMLTDGRSSLSDDWRGSLVNNTFEALLSGRSCVRIHDQQITIENSANAAI